LGQVGRDDGGCDGHCNETIVLRPLRQAGQIHERRPVRKTTSDVDSVTPTFDVGV
jgi:hypothetical protein